MKKLFTILSLVLLGFAFASCDELQEGLGQEGLEDQNTTLVTLCKEINDNLISLSTIVDALMQGDYVVDAAPVTSEGASDGYKITFNDAGVVRIYFTKVKSDMAGLPKLGVMQDNDGVYCWTLNGDVLEDAKGNKVAVSSETNLELKVDNANWAVSYDGGKTWVEVAAAETSADGSYFLFKEVNKAEDAVTITMADGMVLTLPVGDAEDNSSEVFNISVSLNKIDGLFAYVPTDTLHNEKGQSIAEALGYSTWKEAAETSPLSSFWNQTNQLIIEPYDLTTGEPFSDEYPKFDGMSHLIGKDGYPTVVIEEMFINWSWLTDEEYLREEFVIIVYDSTFPVSVGDSYAFGILLTSPKGQARIVVTIDIVEFDDPEKGQYDTPAMPGRYEFSFRNELDLRTMTSPTGSSDNYLEECVKTTLGMTSYEVREAIDSGEISCYYHLNDGGMYPQTSIMLGVEGNMTYGNDAIVELTWNFSPIQGFSGYSYCLRYVDWSIFEEKIVEFTPAVYAAVGKTISYDYVLEYNGYELIFTHEIYIDGDESQYEDLPVLLSVTEQYEMYQQVILQFASEDVSVTMDPDTYQTIYDGTGKILYLTIHAEKDAAGNVYIPSGTYSAATGTSSPYTWQVTDGQPENNLYWGSMVYEVSDGTATIVSLNDGTVEVEEYDGYYIFVLESGDYKLRHSGYLPVMNVPSEGGDNDSNPDYDTLTFEESGLTLTMIDDTVNNTTMDGSSLSCVTLYYVELKDAAENIVAIFDLVVPEGVTSLVGDYRVTSYPDEAYEAGNGFDINLPEWGLVLSGGTILYDNGTTYLIDAETSIVSVTESNGGYEFHVFGTSTVDGVPYNINAKYSVNL